MTVVALQARVRSVELDGKDQRAALEKIEALQESLAKVVDRLTKRVDDLADAGGAKAAERIAAMESRVAETTRMQLELAQHDDRIEALEEASAEGTSEAGAPGEELLSLDGRVGALEATLAEGASHAELAGRLEAAEVGLAEARAELKQRDAQIEELLRRLEALEGRAPESASEPESELASESESEPASDILLLVTVAGAQGAEAGEAPAELEGETRSEEQQLFDDLLAPNEEERATLDLPRLTHQAVMRVGPGGPSLVARIGGVERPVQGVLGATEAGVVVASASRPFGCTVGIVDWETWEPRWLEVGGCLHSGSVAPGPRGDAVYGTMRVAELYDPVVGDAEVVRVDLEDGRITQLTHDGVEDGQVIAALTGEGVRLAIQRRPRTTYARFAPAYVCTALAPTEPGQPFTPRPPPATPPPLGEDEAPDPP